jgi:hypothetical protein
MAFRKKLPYAVSLGIGMMSGAANATCYPEAVAHFPLASLEKTDAMSTASANRD